MQIREALEEDLVAVWKIFSEVIKTGDTYAFFPETPKTDMQKYWFANGMKTFIAEEGNKVLGTYIIRPKQVGLGNFLDRP